MAKLVLSIDDLSDDEIARVLDRAAYFEGSRQNPQVERDGVIGLMFTETSLRTRVGFAAAASRLGWRAIDIFERRHSPSSMTESWGDTLRTLSGYLDVLVARPGEHLDRALLADSLSIPYLSGGDVGPDAEHPSQALIDVYAIEQELGALRALTIAICGDLRMRSVRSLLKLLARRAPRHLVLITLPEVGAPESVPPQLSSRVEFRPPWALEDVDILYVAGIPHGAVSQDRRSALRVTWDAIATLPTKSVILSPLPVIDEIDSHARADPRIRMFEQSDRALFVRMAVLEEVVRTGTDRGSYAAKHRSAGSAW